MTHSSGKLLLSCSTDTINNFYCCRSCLLPVNSGLFNQQVNTERSLNSIVHQFECFYTKATIISRQSERYKTFTCLILSSLPFLRWCVINLWGHWYPSLGLDSAYIYISDSFAVKIGPAQNFMFYLNIFYSLHYILKYILGVYWKV